MAELSMTCLNWWTAPFFVILVKLLTHEATGLLVVKPQDTCALAGQVAALNCSTSSAEDVHWYYGTTYVYAGKKLFHPYLEKCKVEVYQIDNSTAYNLVFLSVKPEDAGTYNCHDDQGRGDLSSADITVLAADGTGSCHSSMKQDGVVIPNDCNIDPDEVQLSYSVNFYGKTPPQLEWKKVPDNGDSVTNTECQTANNRVTCNASVTGDQQMNRTSYECQTTGSHQLNIILCTIEVKNLIHASSATTTKQSSVGTAVQCNPDTSQICHYKWKYAEIVVSTIRSMTPDKTGLYQCEAECNIRGKRCIVFDYAYISQDYAHISQSDDSTPCSTGCVVAICLTILVLILTFIFLLLLKKERSKIQKLSSSDCEIAREANEQDYDKLDKGTLQQNEELPILQVDSSVEELQNQRTQYRQQKAELEERLNSGKRTIEKLQNQFTELRQQKAVLEERLISEATDHRMRLAEAEGKKVELQEKVKRLDEAEGKKIELQEKVQRLFKRNHELGVSLYLPPKDSFEYKVEPQKTVKTRASKEPQNLGVCGVTLLDKELFVISDQHPEVEVYDMWTFKHSRNIPLHGVHDPGDIAACNENRCIYIVDWTERNLEDKLLRLDADGKEEIKRLYMKDDECRLFVTRELNVLVTFHRSRKIVEYARDWSVVFQTNFKDASIYPIHSVKLSNGLFAICHGTINESTHRVCIVDDQGHLLKSFGGRRGAGVEQVNFPTYLTVDRNDNILVTDRDNRRVLVLNCRLELTVELLAEKDGIRRPRSLLLDETNGRLVVADCDEKFDNGQLLIFNVK